MPGMPEILARGGMLGINFLLEPRLLVARMRRSRNLKICLQRMQNTLRRSPLSPVSKSLTIGMGEILACQPKLET